MGSGQLASFEQELQLELVHQQLPAAAPAHSSRLLWQRQPRWQQRLSAQLRPQAQPDVGRPHNRALSLPRIAVLLIVAYAVRT